MRSTDEASPSAIARSDPSLVQSGRSTARALHVLAAEAAGCSTAFVTISPSSAATTCSAVMHARAVLGLGRRGAEVRRDDHVVRAEQRVLGDRLGGEHVERRAADLARLDRDLERLVVDQLAAGEVDDPHAVASSGRTPRR